MLAAYAISGASHRSRDARHPDGAVVTGFAVGINTGGITSEEAGAAHAPARDRPEDDGRPSKAAPRPDDNARARSACARTEKERAAFGFRLVAGGRACETFGQPAFDAGGGEWLRWR